VLRDYLTRRGNRAKCRSGRHSTEVPPSRRGLVSLRSAVIFAIATAEGVTTGWSRPEFGLGAWLVLVVSLDAIIDRDPLR
jgi:acid phosphatase family membrane protein YuiD